MPARLTPLIFAVSLVAGTVSANEDHLLFAEGKTLYKDFCSHCHGIDMVNPGTSSYDLRKWPTDNKAGFADSVLSGKGDMPAWGDILLSEEVDALWVYVATRGGKEPFPDGVAAAPTVPPVPQKH